jgi:hypothetical protein
MLSAGHKASYFLGAPTCLHGGLLERTKSRNDLRLGRSKTRREEIRAPMAPFIAELSRVGGCADISHLRGDARCFLWWRQRIYYGRFMVTAS